MQKQILIFTNDDSHFYAHLLPIALAAKQSGYLVSLLTNITNYKEKIEAHHIKVIPLVLDRKSINPFKEFFIIIKIIGVIHKERPDILHNLTIKPIVYGTIASWFCACKLKVINNFLGMGFIFISSKSIHKIIKKLICTILSLNSKFRKSCFIVQNHDDKQVLIDYSVTSRDKIFVQCSVGVDITQFQHLRDPGGKIVFALVSRMLIDKGVNEFVEAARILKKQNIEAEYWLVGAPDAQNKSSLSLEELKTIDQEGIVRYLGFKEDITKVWEQAHVAVLPSYREGLSRSLLEAGAYGRAIITTNAPGGRELITNRVNGLLVKPKDATELAEAVKQLVLNSALRLKLGSNIRRHILEKFDSKIIAGKMVEFYER